MGRRRYPPYTCSAMKLVVLIACMVGTASSLPATTIDVTTRQTQLLQSGDSLDFLFTDATFARFATLFGASPDPRTLSFLFGSLPLSSGGQFTAAIDSYNGSASVEFPGSVNWTSGTIAS